MQEDVEEKSVRLAVQVTKLTIKSVGRALLEYGRHLDMKNMRDHTADKHPVKGKQTVKQLLGQDQMVTSMDVSDTGIRDFKKIANKYGVDFAIVKDKSKDPPLYTVFFKSKDAAAITQAMQEYGNRKMKGNKEKEDKPSVLQKLKEYKEKVARSMPRKTRMKRKELADR